MFICNECLENNYQEPVILFLLPQSKGPCECCDLISVCYDIPSSQLVDKE